MNLRANKTESRRNGRLSLPRLSVRLIVGSALCLHSLAAVGQKGDDLNAFVGRWKIDLSRTHMNRGNNITRSDSFTFIFQPSENGLTMQVYAQYPQPAPTRTSTIIPDQQIRPCASAGGCLTVGGNPAEQSYAYYQIDSRLLLRVFYLKGEASEYSTYAVSADAKTFTMIAWGAEAPDRQNIQVFDRQADSAAEMQARAQSYKTTFISLSPGQPGVLYEPLNPGPKAAIGIFAMHDNGDYLSDHPEHPCGQLASRGYRVLCANSTASKSGFFSDDDIDKLLLNVKAGVAVLRANPAVHKVLIFGHSGGGAMMAVYQNIAENGVKACRGPEKLVQCPDSLANMPPADGVMLMDAVLGGSISTLVSLDPSLIDPNDATHLDPKLDMYNPANGFDPKGSHYSAEFERRFFAGEGALMNKLIATAQERLQLIEAGKGRFKDDEPFIVPSGYGVFNRLNAQDVSLQSRTRKAWPLLHPDGTVTTEIIHTVRTPRFDHNTTPFYSRGATTTTVRKFLSTWAIRTNSDYHYDASNLYGVDFTSNYSNEVWAIAGFTKPLLQVGMTGSYEFYNSEIAREHAASADKTLVYVEGATHDFLPCTACAVAKGLPENYYGDTVKTLYDYIDSWIAKPGRFLQEKTK
jgi:hypothetical protein